MTTLEANAHESRADERPKLTDEQYRKVMRKGWNLTPDPYEAHWVPRITHLAEGVIGRAALRPGETVLDLATGPGTAAFLAADRVGPEGKVIATDISDAFVERSRRRAESEPGSAVTFVRCPMEQLDLPDESVDVVVCVLGLLYAAPHAEAFSEIHRVLRPGGRFVGCVWGRRNRCAILAEALDALEEALPVRICPLFFMLGNPGAFATHLENAGFGAAKEERLDASFTWGSADELCTGVFPGGPAALPYQAFPPDVRLRVNQDYLRRMERFRVGDGFTTPAEFVYATATK